MMRRHTKVLRRPDEDEYIPRHAVDLRNTRNDLDLRDRVDAEPATDGDGDRAEDA
ncbi:hypothetical protein ACQP2P_44390 [Dactylosporangium sp. CA-139114]|uniref:hypothetical protein n=1 Tax=Dactylosporangium sp. CA-139114 TaxID=3239931 RepID=UPI003D98DDD1